MYEHINQSSPFSFLEINKFLIPRIKYKMRKVQNTRTTTSAS